VTADDITTNPKTSQEKTPQIVISDREAGLPFSKGLLASQVMVTGLSPLRAYEVADAVEDRLVADRRLEVTSEEVGDVACQALREVAGERYAKNFLRWREVERLDVPLVILIGGATGVGKSTIATQLAARLGIVRVVATDAVREVMRSMLSAELMPTLHVSSFQADEALREPPSRSTDPVILGFREQTAAVCVGVDALIDRAADEGMSIVIEGAHVVPGFFDVETHGERILAVPFVIGVDDEDRHRSHFAAREDAVAARPAHRYEVGFDNIRKVQRWVKSQALSHGVPVIPNYSFDQSIAAVIDLVMERATARAAELRADSGGRAASPDGAAGMGQTEHERTVDRPEPRPSRRTTEETTGETTEETRGVHA
jgi:2-phosphoglycerate kinase